MKVTNWDSKAILYIIDINGKSKLGICTNWEARQQQYKKNYGDVPIQLFLKTDFDQFWQAELVEQVTKIKLSSLIEEGLHEWFKDDTEIQDVLESCKQIRTILERQYALHEHIHKKGNHRWRFYKRVFETIKPRITR